MKFTIAPEDAARRIATVSALREMVRSLRRAARAAYERGEITHAPPYDIREDFEYWQRLAEEKDSQLEAAKNTPPV